MKFIQYPRTRQFRDVITSVRRRGTYAGRDENNNPVYDSNRPLPELKFLGTVKMHGTNAGVVRDIPTKTQYAQSRKRVLSLEKDNNGFARFVEEVPDMVWDLIFDEILTYYIDTDRMSGKITLFGEWIGRGINKDAVGVSEIDQKVFVVFGAFVGSRAIRGEEAGDVPDGYWISLSQFPAFDKHALLAENNIYLITEISPVYLIDIDFENPALSQNSLVKWTQEIEAGCPVADFFGVENGTGEGIVWRCTTEGWEDTDFWFKTKGDKHTASKVRTIAEIDVTKVNNVNDFVDRTVTESRLKQGLSHLEEMNLPFARSSTGEYLRWVVNDIATEEADVMEASMLTAKDIGRPISSQASKWFFNYLDTQE